MNRWMANAVRGHLKKISPELADAVESHQENIMLQDMLEATRAKQIPTDPKLRIPNPIQFQGMPLPISPATRMGWAQKLANAPQVGSQAQYPNALAQLLYGYATAPGDTIPGIGSAEPPQPAFGPWMSNW